MTSSVLTKFDKIEYYNELGELIKSKSLVNSTEIKNEMLGMMNADFADNELPPKIELLDDLDLSIEELEILSEISIIQSNYEEFDDIDKYDSYSTSLGEKLIIIRAPKECTKLVLIDTESNTKYNIEFNLNNQYLVDDVDKVEKMVLITQSGSTMYINPSALIHENSLSPHSNLSDKILTSDKFYDLITTEEVVVIDGEVVHSKSDSIIGTGEDPYFSTPTSILVVDDSNKLIINNKYL